MKSVWGTRWWAAVAGLLGALSCTKLIDHSAVRCNNDDDCTYFSHYHPFCRDNVCVASGLAPESCDFAANQDALKSFTREQFLNQCSTNFLPPKKGAKPESCLIDDRVPDMDAGLVMPGTRQQPKAGPTMKPASKCVDLVPAGKKPLFLSGSSNFQPLLKELAPAIVSGKGLYPVFRITTSCIGAYSMNPSSPSYNNDHYIKDPTNGTDAYAQIFRGNDAMGNNQDGMDCLLGSDGITVDVGESEIYPDTCQGPVMNDPKDVIESLGPILPMVFVVNPNSAEQAIKYENARQVFGGGGGVMPWENPQQIFVRGNGTATLRLLAKELGLAPTQVWGIDQGSATNMAVNVGGANDSALAAQTIGILGTDLYDQYRGSLRPLAFQARAQNCAYVPDSALTTYDKLNVRDGHYELWGRIHFYIARNGGTPVSTDAANFVFDLTKANLDLDILTAFIKAYLVPTCAMKVKRDTELGDLTFNDPPPHACGCIFDKIAQGLEMDKNPPGCAACTSNDGCTDKTRPYCNYGYCEASQ